MSTGSRCPPLSKGQLAQMPLSFSQRDLGLIALLLQVQHVLKHPPEHDGVAALSHNIAPALPPDNIQLYM